MTRTLALIVLLCGFALAHAQPVTPETQAFADFTRDWRDDPVWKDGKAEVAVYRVTVKAPHQEQSYDATVVTRRVFADPDTKTVSKPNQGREVFQQVVREDMLVETGIPNHLTMVFVGVGDLKSLRIDMSVQNQLGTTFKWFANHKGTLDWHQFSHVPGEGHKTGTYTPPPNFAFQDALSVILRGYPFDNPPATLELALLPDQTREVLTVAEPPKGVAAVRYQGRETLALPIGRTDAHHLIVSPMPDHEIHYWFATEPKAPMLRAMVQYQEGGVTYKLRSIKREAYPVEVTLKRSDPRN